MEQPQKTSSQGFHTESLHAGQTVDPTTLSRAVPIYQTSSFLFRDTDHANRIFDLEEEGFTYSRVNNPTVESFEKRMATLEKGVGGLATSSGQSAIFTAILTLLKAGDEIISASEIYGGTYSLFSQTLARMGIQTHFINILDPQQLIQTITDKTKLLFSETISNPSLTVPDISTLAQIAHEHQMVMVLDNTVASPYLCNPIEWGADVVVHSATKYIGGHGTSIGGIIVDGGTYPWQDNRFPEFTEPNPNYHQLNLIKRFGTSAFIVKARSETLKDVGCCMSPFNAFLFLQGLETLPIRMKKHGENAADLARFLKDHPNVAWVNYPGLFQKQSQADVDRYLHRGYGGLVTFGVKGGYQAGVSTIERVKLFSFLANIGDAKSLIIHPASSTHRQLTEQQLQQSGVSQDMIRLSVGLEDIQDLMKDLDNALMQ